VDQIVCQDERALIVAATEVNMSLAGGAMPAPVQLPSRPAAPMSPSASSKAAAKTPAERVQEAEAHKVKGNSEFQAGNLLEAIKEYEQALHKLGVRMLSPSRSKLPETDERVAPAVEEDADLAARSKACRVPTQLNLALCCLRLDPCEASRALEMCESVLDAEPENAKAMYRKGKALIELDLLDEAEWELTRACKLLPKDLSVRQDLQKLRQSMRDTAAAEKRTYKGVFQKGAGFASDGREAEAAGMAADTEPQPPKRGEAYKPFKKFEENPFATSENPAEEAVRLQDSGKLEEAIWALEAALERSKRDGDASARCRHLLELGRSYMDLNIDCVALSCLGECLSEANSSEDRSSRRHALLLSGICLLNEAESDPEKEVCQAISAWLALVRPASVVPKEEGQAVANLGDQLRQWRESEGGGADVAVAQGLLHLASGQFDEALQDFVAVLRAPEDEACFFGSARRQAAKWNMLGAVLANRRRHQEALTAYEWAMRLQPHYPRALTNQGIAFQAANKQTKAAASFATAIAITPSFFVQELWPLLEKAAEQSDHTEQGMLAEAALDRNLGKVQELLGAEMALSTACPADTLEQVLDQIIGASQKKK